MTGSKKTIKEHKSAWQKKPALRMVYQDLYRQMAKNLRSGNTLEIGGGTGNFKSFAPDVVSSDIQVTSWLDVVCDAHRLPFADSSFDNIVMFDVFHHLERPKYFLDDAERVLKRNGRLLMIEPAITPISRFFFTFFHSEKVDMKADPFSDGMLNPNRDPYDSNQAIPTLIFKQQGARYASLYPNLNAKCCQYKSLFAYPLTGGFRPWTLIPTFLVKPMLLLENFLMPIIGRFMAFRIFVVLERR